MVKCDKESMHFFVDKDTMDQLNVQEKSFGLKTAGVNGMKEMTGEELGIKVTTANFLESLIFYVHPATYFAIKTYHFLDLMKKYSHMDVSPGDSMDPKKYKVILGQ